RLPRYKRLCQYRHGVDAVQAIIEQMTREMASSGKRIVAAPQPHLRVLADIGICVDRDDVVARPRLNRQLAEVRSRNRRYIVARAKRDIRILLDGDVVVDVERIDSTIALNSQMAANCTILKCQGVVAAA